ncbi:MAG: aminotransferase class IV [Bacteroidales bacterium]|nr:aminotransferase class IV [Bacteroidales bacterium]
MAISSTPNILLNGNFHSQTSLIFNTGNRAFSCGDCISESIHTCADRLCFIDEHLQHLRQGMEAAMMAIPEKFNNKDKVFSREISRMLTKNRVFRGSLVTIYVFRSVYAPMSSSADTIEYVVRCEPLDCLGFKINDIGLKMGVVPKMILPVSPMSNYFTHDNALVRVAMQKKCLVANIDDAIVFNHEGNIVETANSGNLFIIKDNTIYTPPLADGCKADVMRAKILEVIAPKLGFAVVSDKSLKEADLKHTTEMFAASTVTGIRWVAAYKTLRFMRIKTNRILKELSKLYESQE